MSNDSSSRVPAGVPTGGQFATTSKGEADVSLTSSPDLAPYSDDAYEAPLSREELKAVWDKETELRRMEDAAEYVRLADGSRVEVVANETVGTIIESGEYFVIDEQDGETAIYPFADLSERGKVAAKIAETAARDHRANRAVQSAPTVDTDPWGTTDSDDDDVAGVCPDCDNDLTSAQVMDGYCPACADAENAATIAVHVESEARLSAEAQEAQADQEDDEYEHPLFGKVIHSYTRADALRDGVLVDHSTMAKEAGITWPVALTIGAQSETVTWTRGDAGQDEEGRAWDVLMQCRRALSAQGNREVKAGERIPFQVLRIPNTGRGQRPLLTTLHAVVGPDDNRQPCITILLPDED